MAEEEEEEEGRRRRHDEEEESDRGVQGFSPVQRLTSNIGQSSKH